MASGRVPNMHSTSGGIFSFFYRAKQHSQGLGLLVVEHASSKVTASTIEIDKVLG